MTHNIDFIAQLFQTGRGIDEAEIETLDGIVDARDAMRNHAYRATDARAQDFSRSHAVIDFFNGRIKQSLQYSIAGEEASSETMI